MTDRARCRLRRCARPPAYPTKLEVLALPRLLKAHQPPAWMANGTILAATSAFLAANVAGCHSPAPTSGTQPPPPSKAPAIVAPLFEHGDGRGSAGCVAVSPPVFLSEEEALQIIVEELQPHGIELSGHDVELPSVIVKHKEFRQEQDGRRQGGRWVQFEAPLHADGVDSEHHIAVEFASRDDFDDLAGPWYAEGVYCTATFFDMREVAGYVADQARGRPEGVYFGVFYDPLEGRLDFAEFRRRSLAANGTLDRQRHRQVHEELSEQGKNKSAELLRQQVRDFVEWLKGQGVI
ncbi:MAG: hypothetical protein PVJ57_12060 [Phycisphaerae bacterium]|jgi:hypothetical protein